MNLKSVFCMRIKLTAGIVLWASMAFALTEVVDGVTWSYALSSDRTATVTGIPTTTSGDVMIPSILGGYPVTGIETSAFYRCSSLTSVTMPDCVTCIGSNAFKSCKLLENIRMSVNVTNIGMGAFHYCRSLKRVIIPNGVSVIGKGMFYYCSALTNVTISKGVESIGVQAFSYCTSLESITIPDSVTTIEGLAFSGCSSLKDLVIPANVTNIASYAFLDCESLTSVIIKGCASIGDSAFERCLRLKTLMILSGMRSVGKSAFYQENRALPNNIVINGPLPDGIEKAGLCNGTSVHYVCSRESLVKMRSLLSNAVFKYFYQSNRPFVEYVSVKVRENNPTILDCVYRVNSGNPTVKVRALAFKDGVRSFANVVRPETFIEGTAANVGDAVAANTELKLSWQVSADWNIDLANVKFEILATEDELLPLELRTIPANGSNKAMEFSWNAITEDQVFDALLWLYADKDGEMILADGVLKNGSTILAEGDCLYRTSKYISGKTVYSYTAPAYVFRKMGFLVLDDENLTYAKSLSRLELIPNGVRQYCYRWIEQ